MKNYKVTQKSGRRKKKPTNPPPTHTHHALMFLTTNFKRTNRDLPVFIVASLSSLPLLPPSSPTGRWGAVIFQSLCKLNLFTDGMSLFIGLYQRTNRASVTSSDLKGDAFPSRASRNGKGAGEGRGEEKSCNCPSPPPLFPPG